MLIYSKIDGFHKFAKYTLCPPKSNPDYGSAFSKIFVKNKELLSTIFHAEGPMLIGTKSSINT